MRKAITTLVFASFLVFAPPILAEDVDDSSPEEIEAPEGEMAPPVDAEPPAEPIEAGEDEEEDL